jgi:hypothetical protein
MSSAKTKKVHYERGTKGEESEKPHRSRDSGIGSSSASDKASLGTPQNEHFNRAQIESQRNVLSAVQEALDSANERIKELEATNAKLNKKFMESNKENRLLKKEKAELMDKVEQLEYDLSDEKKKNKRLSREGSPKSKDSKDSKESKSERRKTPPKIEYKHEDRSGLERRLSVREHMIVSPQSLRDPNQNPFIPLNHRGPYVAPLVTYPAPGAVSYTPNSLSYSAAPAYAHSVSSNRHSPTSGRPYQPNDGLYHLSPV